MGRGFHPALFLALLASPLGAQQSYLIVKQGPYFVQTVTGTLAIGSSQRIRVRTLGNLAFQGGGLQDPAPDSLAYSLIKRVRAGSLAEAQAAFRELELRSEKKGAWFHLDLSTPKQQMVSAELVLKVPRHLAQARLETKAGTISAARFDGEITAETSGGLIDLDELRSNVTAKTGGGEIHAGRIEGTLRCISGGGAIRVSSAVRECWLDTAGGDICVREASAPIHAATAGGNIRVDRAAAEIYARTGAGLIEVGQAGGLVTAETSGGAIQVNGARGVRCESSAGTIRLRNMQGTVRAATARGSILAHLQSGQRLEDSILSTVLGDIIVLLSSNIPVTIQARNESAGSKRRIVSDFQEIRIRNANWDSNDPVLAEGALNGGGPVLRIITSAGVIFLRRQP